MSASEASSLVGRRLGRFRILSRIGQGGLATVWRAHDELLGRDVALKVLNDSPGDALKDRKRFAHEAQAASALDHPGIVTVFDAGESEGLYYIALTLIDGDTLSDLARSRLLPIDEVVRVVAAAADALAHAHSRGVFHRDVSGRNVMVARDGRVFVLDFGLALMAGLSRVTTRETTMGTFAYMAPEAWKNQGLDGRADVYSLGVVLFEALTGTYPHKGDRPEQLVSAKLNVDARPPSEVRADVPPELDWIAARALARDPNERYASMHDLLRDLRLYGRGSGIPVAEERSPALPASMPRRTPEPGEETQVTLPDPVYLTVLPFMVDEAVSESEGLRSVASRLPRTIAAAASSVRRVRVVRADGIDANQTDREIAEQVGANLVLRGEIARSGSRVRLTFALLDALRGLQVGGGVVDGSEVQPFELEDAVIASVRSMLGDGSAGAVQGIQRPPDPAAEDRFKLAVRHLERSDRHWSVDAAIEIMESLILSQPSDPSIHAALARACIAKYQLGQARVWMIRASSQVQAALELDPAHPDVLIAAAELKFMSGQAEEARQAMRALVERSPETFDAWLVLARAEHALIHDDEAEVCCSRAIALRPNDWRAHNTLGLIRYEHGDYEGAVECWREVLRVAPDNPRGQRNLGSAYFHLDRHEEAAEAYRASLENLPISSTYSNLGTVLFYLERRPEAIDAFERAVALDPLHALNWGNLGNACRTTPGFEERARTALERASALMTDGLDRNPQYAEGWARLAGWKAGLGDFKAARAALDRALALAPAQIQVLNSGAHVMLQLGCREEALGLLRQAVGHGMGSRQLVHDPEFAVLHGDAEFQQLITEAGSRSRTHLRGSSSAGR